MLHSIGVSACLGTPNKKLLVACASLDRSSGKICDASRACADPKTDRATTRAATVRMLRDLWARLTGSVFGESMGSVALYTPVRPASFAAGRERAIPSLPRLSESSAVQCANMTGSAPRRPYVQVMRLHVPHKQALRLLDLGLP